MRRHPALALVPLLVCAAAASAAPASPLGPVTVRTIATPGEPRVAAVSGGSLWVLVDRGAERRVVEIDASGRRTGRDVLVASGVRRDFPFLVPSIARPSLAATPGSLWTVDPVARVLVRVRTADGAVERLPVGADYVAAGAGGVWVLPTGGVAPEGGGPGLVFPLARVDPQSGAVMEIRAVRSPHSSSGGRGGGLGPVEAAVTRRRLWLSFVSPERFPASLDLASGALSVRGSFGWQLTARGTTLAATRRTTCDVRVVPDTGPAARIAMLGEAPCRGAFVRDVALGAAGTVWAAFDHGRSPGTLVGRRPGSPARFVALIGTDPVDVVTAGRVVWVLDRAGRSVTRMVPAPG